MKNRLLVACALMLIVTIAVLFTALIALSVAEYQLLTGSVV